jgi:hypothetical protein
MSSPPTTPSNNNNNNNNSSNNGCDPPVGSNSLLVMLSYNLEARWLQYSPQEHRAHAQQAMQRAFTSESGAADTNLLFDAGSTTPRERHAHTHRVLQLALESIDPADFMPTSGQESNVHADGHSDDATASARPAQ